MSSLCCGELFVSEPAICHPTISHISAVLPLRAHVRSMSIDRATLGGNKGNFEIVIYIPIHPYIYVHRGSTFTYIPWVMFVSEFSPTPQMTGPKQGADSTTLRVQPCRTAAIGYIMYVRVACPRSAAEGCFCRSLSSVNPP